MNVMVGVAIALLGAGRARADARVEHGARDEVVPVAGTRENPGRDVTDIATELTERDAFAQSRHVLFDQV
jgi:hypothetical protein